MKLYKSLVKQYKNLNDQLSNKDCSDLQTISKLAEENLQLICEESEKINNNINSNKINIDDWENWYTEFFALFHALTLFISIGTVLLFVTIFQNFAKTHITLSSFINIIISLSVNISISSIKANYVIGKGFLPMKKIKLEKQLKLLDKYEKLKVLYEELNQSILIKDENSIEDNYFKAISELVGKTNTLTDLKKRNEYLNKIDNVRDYYEKALIEIKNSSDEKHTELERNLQTSLIKILAEIEFSLDSEIGKEQLINKYHEDSSKVEKQIALSRSRTL